MCDFEGIDRIRGNKSIEVRVKAVFDSRVNIYICPSLKDQSFAYLERLEVYLVDILEYMRIIFKAIIKN